MRRLTLGALVIACLAACGELAHPVSNDGNDVGFKSGANPGTGSLSLSADSTAIAVGSGVSIKVMYNSEPFPFNTALLTTASSDSTKVECCAFGVSVGSATLTYSYNGAQASIGISVHQNSAGASARLTASTNPNTGVSSWVTDSVQVPVSSLVEFALFPDHNVVFDSVPGAPSNIPAPGGTASSVFVFPRSFATPGVFTFHCSVHGESGVVVITR
jgi:hypothetical protein